MQSNSHSTHQLLYIADPMCSWCYGFGPELEGLMHALPEAKLDIIVGGLRAYNTEVLTDDKRNTILGHWQHVAEASGLPFSEQGMRQVGFIYDTEPACRAVVAARALLDDGSGQVLLAVFHAIQRAFYAEGADITNEQILARVAVASLNQQLGDGSFDEASFIETLQAPTTRNEARGDFEQCQRWGIRGFPALLLLHDNALHSVAAGYTKTANLLDAIKQIRDTNT